MADFGLVQIINGAGIVLFFHVCFSVFLNDLVQSGVSWLAPG